MLRSKKIGNITESIFALMTRRAAWSQSVNLSQGFPDEDCPQWLIGMAQRAMEKNKNQYAPYTGVFELRKEISRMSKKFYNIDIDPDSQVTITNGATEGLFSSILSLVEEGDEVLLLAPFYDSYRGSILMTGAKPVEVILKAPEFRIEKDLFKTDEIVVQQSSVLGTWI